MPWTVDPPSTHRCEGMHNGRWTQMQQINVLEDVMYSGPRSGREDGNNAS